MFSNFAFNLPFLLFRYVVVTNKKKKKKKKRMPYRKSQIHQTKKYPYKWGFLLRILWCSQSGYHPGNNLAKFGYKMDMKVGGEEEEDKKQSPFIFLITFWKLLKRISWKFGKNWNVPLVFLERSWWAGFDGIYLARVGLKNVGDTDF